MSVSRNQARPISAPVSKRD